LQSFVIEKEDYTPGEFVKKYSERFPLHVRVSKGFYGNSETTSVSEGDTFNIHFIKKTKVHKKAGLVGKGWLGVGKPLLKSCWLDLRRWVGGIPLNEGEMLKVIG